MLGIISVACQSNGSASGETTNETTDVTDQVTTDTAPESESSDDEENLALREEGAEFLSGITDRKGYELVEGDVYYHGRWFDKKVNGVDCKVNLASGSSMHFIVKGTDTVKIKFIITTRGKTPYYAVSVDGGEYTRGPINNCEITLPDSGWHTVDFYCDGMDYNEDKWNLESGYAVSGIDCGDGNIFAAKPNGKLFLIYGPSTVEGTRTLIPSSLSGDSNSAVYSYAGQCCSELGVNPYFVGYGGTGVLNDGFFANLGKTIDYYSKNRKAEYDFVPDLILFQHGGNDVNVLSDDFVKKYIADIEKVHAMFPDAPIFVMTPFTQVKAADIKAVADSLDYVTLIETAGWNLTYSDGVHPNRAGAERAGKLLAEKLREILGNEFFK